MAVTKLRGQGDVVSQDKVCAILSLSTQTCLGARLRAGLHFQLQLRPIAQTQHHFATQQSGVHVDGDAGLRLTRLRLLTAEAAEVAAEVRRTAMTAEQILEERAEAAALEVAEIKAFKGRATA